MTSLKRSHTIFGLSTVALRLIVCVAYPGDVKVSSELISRSLIEPDDGPQPDDFSSITGFLGMGDSFPAGIGGPTIDDDENCARGQYGYPNLINQDDRMGDPSKRTFQFLACSGATSKTMIDNQVPQAGQNQQLITLSAGGNDVGLTKILDACVFGFSPSPPDCQTTLANSQKIIDNELSSNLTNLYNAIKPKIATDPNNLGKVYVTGYGNFFNGNTSQCNGVSWSFWYQQLNKQYLTQDLRTRLNDMVDAVNSKIADAVKAAGDQFVFVNWDQYFTRYGGRYCEGFATEPDANHLGLLFYEWDTIDNGEPGPNEPSDELRRSGDTTGNDTFGGDINNFVKQTLDAHPDWTYAQPGGTNDQASVIDPAPAPVATGRCGNGRLKDICTGDTKTQLSFVATVLPKTWLRVFHPHPAGQALIANLVLYYMTVDRAKLLKQQVGPEIQSITACPTSALPTSVSCTSPSTLACATFNAKRDLPAPTVTAKATLVERQGPGVVPFGNAAQNSLPASIGTVATTCSCAA